MKLAIKRLGIGIGCWVAVTAASRADVGSTISGSILVFPHVEVDADRDTIIQIGNTSNLAVVARCFYIDATVPGAWTQSPFVIRLLRQQTTHWVASLGRSVVDDARCTPTSSACDGAGVDPGLIPALPNPFRGELLCVQVDASGAPFGANSLTGNATLKRAGGGDVAKYNALSVAGLDVFPDDELFLDGVEYNACPESWVVNHLSEGVEDAVAGPGSSVETSLTIVPCSQDLDLLTPAPVVVLLEAWDEFELSFSTSTTITCWGSTTFGDIASIFEFAVLGSRHLRTRARTPVGGDPGILLIASEVHTSAAPQSLATSAAVNPHLEGARSTGDVIVLPPFTP